MPAYVTGGETFADGQSVTAARLNNHVNGLTILPAFITGQPAIGPVVADKLLSVHAGALNSPTIEDVLDLQLADTVAGTASMRTLGFTGNKAAPGAETAGLANDNVFSGSNLIPHIGGLIGSNIAIVAEAGLGTGGAPSAGFITRSTDLYGRIQLVSGSTPSNGLLATITFDTAFTNAPFVILVAFAANAIALQAGTSRITVTTQSTTGFTLGNTVNLQASTTYTFSYIVFGR